MSPESRGTSAACWRSRPTNTAPGRRVVDACWTRTVTSTHTHSNTVQYILHFLGRPFSGAVSKIWWHSVLINAFKEIYWLSPDDSVMRALVRNVESTHLNIRKEIWFVFFYKHYRHICRMPWWQWTQQPARSQLWVCFL